MDYKFSPFRSVGICTVYVHAIAILAQVALAKHDCICSDLIKRTQFIDIAKASNYSTIEDACGPFVSPPN